MLNMQKIRDFNILSPKRDTCIAPPLPKIQGSLRKKDWKIVRTRHVNEYEKTLMSGNPRVVLHMNQQHCDSTPKSCPISSRTETQRGGRRWEVPAFTQKLVAAGRLTSLFFNGVQLGRLARLLQKDSYPRAFLNTN